MGSAFINLISIKETNRARLIRPGSARSIEVFEEVRRDVGFQPAIARGGQFAASVAPGRFTLPKAIQTRLWVLTGR